MKYLFKIIFSCLLLGTSLFTFADTTEPNQNSLTSVCDMKAPICTLDMIAYGKVQHVHFREDVLRLSIQHQLTGMDKNLKDGTVHIILQGKPQDVMAVTQLLTENKFDSPHGYITKLKITPLRNSNTISTFTIVNWTSSRYCVSKPVTIVWHPSKPTYYRKDKAEAIVYKLFSPWIQCQPKRHQH